MTDCDALRELLGPYVDGETAPETCMAVEAHVSTCPRCRREVQWLRELGDQIEGVQTPRVPTKLWGRIEGKLNEASLRRRIPRLLRVRSLIAAAACLVVAVGGGYFVLTQGLVTRVEAAPVNFSVLLDGLSVDAEGAFHQFVQLYKGRRVSPSESRQHASQLNFALPQALPGGFDLEQCFALQIGDAPAAAATYRRAGEFIGAIFHRAIHPEDYGTHRDHPCVIGEHRGHRVEVGEWRLVHVTDATTCHCVLSRLDETRELPAILRAVAPDFEPVADHSHPDRTPVR